MANLANIHWLVPDDPIASLQQLQQLPDPPYHPSNITVIRTVPLLSKANLAILFVRKANSIVRDIEIPFMANDDATEKFLRFYAPSVYRLRVLTFFSDIHELQVVADG